MCVASGGRKQADDRVAREFECRHRVVVAHRRKIVEKIVEKIGQGVTAFEIVDERLKRHTGSAEDWRASQDLRIAMDD